MNKQSMTVPMPKEIEIHNGTHEPCDMLIGPCSCGAWHITDNLENIIKILRDDKGQNESNYSRQ